MGYGRPWPWNFKGTIFFAVCAILGSMVGMVVEFLGIYPGSFWLGLFVGSMVGAVITYRSPKYWSEARRREKEVGSALDELASELRSEAMRTQPIATIGCTVLYFAVFIGAIALFVFWMFRISS